MCLAVPAKVLTLDGAAALVDVGGNRVEANVSLVPDVEVGDYVMVHAGFAITKYEPEDAAETLRVLREAGLLANAGEEAAS